MLGGLVTRASGVPAGLYDQHAKVMCLLAGQKFQAIAQQDLKNTSALHNWAKSICIRASLKDNAEVSSSCADETRSALEMVMLSQLSYRCLSSVWSDFEMCNSLCLPGWPAP